MSMVWLKIQLFLFRLLLKGEYNLELDQKMLRMGVAYKSRLHAFPGW
jgi:hypothetical protein